MRTVLFDVDGVIVYSRFHTDPARRHFWDKNLLRDLGVAHADFQQLFQGDFDPVMRGEVSLINRLAEFLPTIGYQGSPLSFVNYWNKNDIKLNQSLLTAIKMLETSGEAALYLATNQEHLRASYLWSEADLGSTFKDMFYGARLGAIKPELAYFEAVAQLLGPQDMPPLFFDDSEKNVAVANDFGWEAIHYTTLDDFSGHPWIATHLKPA